ncbi:nitroreductase [Paenibacillus barcinonensis]|uniref:Putative NAD(P)H nitroreductase n=1 Tax=Paenibacillus barcinonensis TaxID=198119 RepID=A0A2V4VEP7_PAEBA|nr:nitroreductase [Paenibacillus barcinonensis]PYE52216.1 nitroreductase [Paenibacillus barcinonensis]QKS59650.1 nitroreductase [Paenibacillus barcinonensis]
MSKTTNTGNAVRHAIQSRRTVKKFKKEAVPTEQIIDLLDTAVWAPNHKLREPWRFVLFSGKGRKKLAEAIEAEMGEDNKFSANVLQVPSIMLVVMEEDPRQAIWDEDFAAASALVQNFMLAAWSEEIGTFWVTKPFLYAPKFRKELGIKAGEKIIGMLYIGYPDVIPSSKERTPAKDKLTLFE